jgi:hypothetical protein
MQRYFRLSETLANSPSQKGAIRSSRNWMIRLGRRFGVPGGQPGPSDALEPPLRPSFLREVSMQRTSATICVTIIAVLAIAGSTTAQSPNRTKLESELRNVMRERWAALARNDVNMNALASAQSGYLAHGLIEHSHPRTHWELIVAASNVLVPAVLVLITRGKLGTRRQSEVG